MARLIWTAEAEQWLKDIYEYIARDSSVSAAHVIDKIIEKAELLTKYPELGHKYES
jgi:plasmid stabilization system protein ParE